MLYVVIRIDYFMYDVIVYICVAITYQQYVYVKSWHKLLLHLLEGTVN